MTNIEPKRTLYFDIETDGLEPTIIHCLVTMDGLGNIRRYNHEELGNVQDGLDALSEAHLLIGQNIIGYDLPAIMKVYPSWATGAAFMDTLVCARLAWPHIKDLDFKRKGNFPKELFGSHSLKAWGVRLGFEKGSYGEDTEDPWARWSMDMEDYCQRDVEVTHRLYQEFLKAEVPEAAVLLEHETHDLMEGMTERGFYFDRQRAEKLYVRLLARKDQLAAELQDLFPPKEIHLKTKVKLKAFNPGSRQQIAERFEQQGWKPTDFTPDGKPRISETILEGLEDKYPEAKTLKEYLCIQKRIGQLAEGKNSWLGLVDESHRIHGRVISCGGTISHRMAHHSPNLAQVPNNRSPYGKECRGLFCVPVGYALVGTDLSGAELRLLAHLLAHWDDGKFAKECETGDPHQANADMAGITRPEAKQMIFALIYGAGDQRLGACVGGSRREGSDLRRRFYHNNPAFKKLQTAIQKRAKANKMLVGLDGRKLFPRSPHSALNLWIQNAAATCTKMATVKHVEALSEKGIRLGLDFHIVAHVFDEWQIEVIEEYAEEVKNTAAGAIRAAGRHYSLNVRLDGDSTIGCNWAETH
jgi:DNA polymerase I-like protein with 3'-5' exonuclease and polymerase domains